MITVTNSKIAGFTPEWASFRGFSILFDSPGDSLRDVGGQRLLACNVDGDPALGLYRSLRDALAELNVRLLTNSYLFCPLPPASYHVTVWDGANDGNVPKLAPAQRDALYPLLDDVAAALREPHELIRLVSASPLIQQQEWNVRLKFSHLSLVVQRVLVAELEAVDAEAQARIDQLIEERSRLSEEVQARYGFSPYHRYWPHVSLGYFANREHAQLAVPCVEQWNRRFAERLSGQSVTFARASVYGFSDMATFFTSGA